MIYCVFGILIIICGVGYQGYRIYFKVKNEQAKQIFLEIKRRVDEGDKKEAYIDLVEEEAYVNNYYQLIKKSRLSKEEIKELTNATTKERNEKKSKVRGISKLSIRIGSIVMAIAFVVGLFIFYKEDNLLSTFTYACIASQLSYLVSIVIVESIKEMLLRKKVKKT